jgi:5-methylcytosine-specific restriction endonuclease McrA
VRTANLKEWIGKTDDEAIPARVKVRVCDKFNKRCVSCTNLVGGGLPAAYDHIQALVNDGENRESNLQLICVPCHKVKTRADVAEKSRVYRRRATFLGVKAKSSRPMPGSKASGLRKKMDGTVERRT